MTAKKRDNRRGRREGRFAVELKRKGRGEKKGEKREKVMTYEETGAKELLEEKRGEKANISEQDGTRRELVVVL